MPTSKALEIAKEEGFDLVEVSPNTTPPVVKIMDWGKFRYEQQKQKTKSQKIEIKGIRLGIKIGAHDLETKLRLAEKFLSKGYKVRFQVRFKGREIVHKELGLALLQNIREKMIDSGDVEQEPEFTGRDLFMTLTPSKHIKRRITEKGKENAENKNP